jgi:hypothetical protein
MQKYLTILSLSGTREISESADIVPRAQREDVLILRCSHQKRVVHSIIFDVNWGTL